MSNLFVEIPCAIVYGLDVVNGEATMVGHSDNWGGARYLNLPSAMLPEVQDVLLEAGQKLTAISRAAEANKGGKDKG